MANENEELEQLKKLSPYSLPDNPSQSGWSTKQVKAKFYQGLFYLYSLFKTLREDMQEILDGDVIVGVSVVENNITFTKASGTTETFEIGSGNANIFYDDTLPSDTSTLKDGDLWFDETD